MVEAGYKREYRHILIGGEAGSPLCGWKGAYDREMLIALNDSDCPLCTRVLVYLNTKMRDHCGEVDIGTICGDRCCKKVRP